MGGVVPFSGSRSREWNMATPWCCPVNPALGPAFMPGKGRGSYGAFSTRHKCRA